MRIFFSILLLIFLPFSVFSQFVNPESAIWDDVHKRYYVSNVSQGTITMIDWGRKTYPSWFTGMNRPKGMLLVDNVLYVVDNTSIVSFNTDTRELIKNDPVPGTTFMNDICMDDEGNFYITDTQGNSIIKYDAKQKKYSKLPLKGFIDKPNGIIYDGDRLIIVSFRENSPIQAISLDDYTVTDLKQTDIDDMDGITKDGKGNIFISAWYSSQSNAGKVFKIKEDFSGDFEVIAYNLGGPADIFYNQLSDTLVIPVLSDNEVIFLPFIDPPPAPKLKEPANGSIYNPKNILKWEKPRAAEYFTVEIADNSLFDNPFFVFEGIEVTSMILEIGGIICDSIWWRVKAFNSEGESPWSDSWYMLPPSPVEPVLLFPPDEATDVNTEFDFIWMKQFQDYRIYVDTVPELGDGDDLIVSDTRDTLYSVSGILQPMTKYYWTIKGIVCDEEADGPVWSFTTLENRLPEKPELIMPENGAENLDPADIECKWNKSERADYYVFFLMADQYYKIILIQDTVMSEGEDIPRYSYMLKDLDFDKEYFWAVHAHNSNGKSESLVYSFKTKAATGVDDKSGSIKVIPNPAGSWVKIEIPDAINSNLKVALFDSKGVAADIEYVINRNMIVIKNLDDLVSGVYLLKISNGDDVIVRKLIIE